VFLALFLGVGGRVAGQESVPAQRDPAPQTPASKPVTTQPSPEASDGAHPVQNGPPAPDPLPPSSNGTDTPPAGQPLVGPPLVAPQPSATVATPSAVHAAALPDYQPTYRAFGEASLLLAAMADAAPERARKFEIGATFDGRPVPAIEIATPGPIPPAQRPTVFLFGALDGHSLSGAEAVLACVHLVLAAPDKLPSDVALIAVPWASPEALDALAKGGVNDGSNPRPVDDDRDGLLDEDGPDDLNDDGFILQMLIEDPAGEWVRCADQRFLARAGPLDQPRYTLTWEGRDDDHDGRYNEDPVGGVILDRNFPLGRSGPWSDPRCGNLPLSEPLARAYADLVLARRAALVIVAQGNHGAIATPGGVGDTEAFASLFASDRALYERITHAFEAATGRTQGGVLNLREACGAERPGAAVDWFAAVAGALSFEIAPWGPRVDHGTEVIARDARFQQAPLADAARAADVARSLEGKRTLCDVSRAWATWVDNLHQGVGFTNWQPVELAGGKKALVGGWEPWTIQDPPKESLANALHGIPEFVLELVQSLPRAELAAGGTRDGEIVHLRASVKNIGRLPTGLGGLCAARRESGVAVELSLPAGARLLAGSARVELPRLVGDETSREVLWIALAPAGSVFEVTTSAPWCAAVSQKVQP
jgi:hypothetical protein